MDRHLSADLAYTCSVQLWDRGLRQFLLFSFTSRSSLLKTLNSILRVRLWSLSVILQCLNHLPSFFYFLLPSLPLLHPPSSPLSPSPPFICSLWSKPDLPSFLSFLLPPTAFLFSLFSPSLLLLSSLHLFSLPLLNSLLPCSLCLSSPHFSSSLLVNPHPFIFFLSSLYLSAAWVPQPSSEASFVADNFM